MIWSGVWPMRVCGCAFQRWPAAGARFGGGGIRQAVIELDHAVLFVTAAGANACIALQASENADLGMVADEISVTVQRIGAYLSTEARNGVMAEHGPS